MVFGSRIGEIRLLFLVYTGWGVIEVTGTSWVDGEDYRWPDKRCVGVVVGWVKAGETPPNFRKHEEED